MARCALGEPLSDTELDTLEGFLASDAVHRTAWTSRCSTDS
jgi:hypothetical protein